MKRVIKFRAWDNYEKKWLLGYEYPNLGGFSMFGECMLFNEWSNILNRFILKQVGRKPEDLILMQFTGLTDKNGKEVYEGDIVKRTKTLYDFCLPDGEDTKEVTEISFITYRHHGFWVDSESFGYEGEDLWNWDEMEIIGNIYENSNLLNQ